MRGIYAGIGVIWVVSLLAGREMGQPPRASSNVATSAEITARAASAVGEVADAPPVANDHPQEPQVDLLGNEIEKALADYRIDLGGSVYERHSPETAVERLGSPST